MTSTTAVQSNVKIEANVPLQEMVPLRKVELVEVMEKTSIIVCLSPRAAAIVVATLVLLQLPAIGLLVAIVIAQ